MGRPYKWHHGGSGEGCLPLTFPLYDVLHGFLPVLIYPPSGIDIPGVVDYSFFQFPPRITATSTVSSGTGVPLSFYDMEGAPLWVVV